MKKLLLAGSIMALMGASSYGATIAACSGVNTNTSFDTSTLAGNTYTCGDKIFSSLTSSAPGSITISELGNANLYDLKFNPTAGSVSTAFTLGFTIAVNTAISPTDIITSFQDQMLTANVNPGQPSIPNTSTASVTHTGGPSSALAATTAQAQTGFVTFSPGVGSTTTLFSYAPGANGTLISAEFVITETTPTTTTTPEPMTFSLVGGGLLALGVIGRRRKTL